MRKIEMKENVNAKMVYGIICGSYFCTYADILLKSFYCSTKVQLSNRYYMMWKEERRDGYGKTKQSDSEG
jgi:hypothetical protein